ncbi:sulfurtransferase [Marinomonas pollencensis]|uniref:Thiosulfate/3-mercaptopyruvate sulfurtransferase n=1 Tax=Marinomonas pollencensis TaxID=491954 RepID=A0A3E0DY49_9GAMM|nr:sulfurtransferase [Marinomonas pollencensis]REG87011.1 thiosulfate/3-mercaptopyruvate sulfurtransferase [Marinomonas pollencensis]
MPLNTLIDATGLKLALEQQETIVLDCRFYLTNLDKGREEYAQGHIPQAIFVDVHLQLAGSESQWTGRHPLPDVEVFADQLQEWGIEPNSTVIVYDDMGGSIAARAWWMLAQQGVDVRVLDGGIQAWREQGFAVKRGNQQSKPSPYRFKVSFPWQITEQQIVENFALSSFLLVDARGQDRYQGENETIDPIAGHIPGALNRPFSENLTETGVFKAKEALVSEWNSVLVEGENLVHYCGSGITACHNVLAMNYAGLDVKQVYVGSWSQWAKRMLRAAKMDT